MSRAWVDPGGQLWQGWHRASRATPLLKACTQFRAQSRKKCKGKPSAPSLAVRTICGQSSPILCKDPHRFAKNCGWLKGHIECCFPADSLEVPVYQSLSQGIACPVRKRAGTEEPFVMRVVGVVKSVICALAGFPHVQVRRHDFPRLGKALDDLMHEHLCQALADKRFPKGVAISGAIPTDCMVVLVTESSENLFPDSIRRRVPRKIHGQFDASGFIACPPTEKG